MKLKNKLSVIFLCAALLAALCLTTAGARTGDVAGNYYSTDIKAIMYFSPITSYNIGGKTVIDAEILNFHYGFDVYWHADTRRLELIDKGSMINSLQAMSGELCQSTGGVPGSVAGQYYETDIVTTLNGKEIESYNIGGRTCIVAEAMRDFGYIVDWNADARTLTIKKPADFYKFQTDYGTIKSMENYEQMYASSFGTLSYDKYQRGILLTDASKQTAELPTPSQSVLVLPYGMGSYVKLSDVCAALNGSCTLKESTGTSHTVSNNGVSCDVPYYDYCFAFTFDKNEKLPLKQAQTEYPKETVTPDGPCYSVIEHVSLSVNGEKVQFVMWHQSIMPMVPGREVDAAVLVLNGIVYIPTYTVAKILGYVSAF